MASTQLDRDIAVAEGLVAALQQQSHNSIFTVFVEMYRRYKRADPPLSVPAAFALGNFAHGIIAGGAIACAKNAGYVTTEKPDGAKYALLHPTDKLLALIQSVVEVEAFSFETAQEHMTTGSPEHVAQ